MKPKRIVFLAVLMMLYIGPLLFMSSYGPSTMPAQPNINKDFSLSADWYNYNWLYRKSVTITVDAGIAGTDYQVLVEVTYDSDMKVDFSDVIFVDEVHETLLDHWLESKTNSTNATFWVEVQDYMSENTNPNIIYMYYGNDAASSTSNGTATFLFYEDWTDENLNLSRWDVIVGDGSISYASGGATHGSIATISGGAGTLTEHIETDLHIASPFALRFRSNIESTVGASQRTSQGIGTAWGTPNEPRSFMWSDAGTEEFLVSDDDQNTDDQPMVDTYHDTYTIWDITRDADTASLVAGGVPIESGDMAPDTLSTNVGIFYVRDSEYQVLSDWIFARNFHTSEPYVSAFGAEEDTEPPPEWELVGTAIIIFLVAIDTTGFDMLLIFLGLILIPSSTLYAVKGGRSEMSWDKLFFVLIAFVIGWALVIGGIMT